MLRDILIDYANTSLINPLQEQHVMLCFKLWTNPLLEYYGNLPVYLYIILQVSTAAKCTNTHDHFYISTHKPSAFSVHACTILVECYNWTKPCAVPKQPRSLCNGSNDYIFESYLQGWAAAMRWASRRELWDTIPYFLCSLRAWMLRYREYKVQIKTTQWLWRMTVQVTHRYHLTRSVG